MTTDVQQLTEDAKVILLLCGHFGDTDAEGSVKPLSLGEYNRLADWMVERKLRPENLLTDRLGEMELGLLPNEDAPRIRQLLNRGPAMALAVEKWSHSGIWIVCRSDDHYPPRLKKHLQKQAPPILFGVGSIDLLSLGGLAIVGSRNVDATGEAYTRKVAKVCAESRMPVVSGGAAGVDQAAMLSALQEGGLAVGVLADSLQKAALTGKYRYGIREKRLVLISARYPESRFHVGHAMGRNKLIYALSDFALIVSAEKEKGGTWAGATEELKRKGGRPVFVRIEEGTPEGNNALLRRGAESFPKPPWNEGFENLLADMNSPGKKDRPTQIQLQMPGYGFQPTSVSAPRVKEEQPPFSGAGDIPELVEALPQETKPNLTARRHL